MIETSLKQKTAKGLFWGGVSNGIEQLFGLAFGIFLARLLSREDYGLVEMLAIFSGIGMTIVTSGFSVALINKKNATHKDYNAVFWFTVFSGLFLYLALFFSAPLIAGGFGRPELLNLSRVHFITLLFYGLTIVPSTIMTKQLMIKQHAMVVMISLLLSGTIGIVMALNGYSYWSLVVQNIVLVFLGFILRFFYVSWKPTFDIDFRPLKEMFSFGSKLLVTGIFSSISGSIFSVVLGKFYNAATLGDFSQGQKWAGRGQSFIGGMINQVTQPILVQVQEEKERQVNVLRKMIRFGAFLSFPLILGMAFAAKEIIIISVGEKWLHSVPFLQLFCLWGAVFFLWNLFVNMIYTHGKSNIYMYVTIFIGVLQIAVVISTYSLGIYSMVIGFILTNFIGLLIWQYYVHQLTGLRLKDVLKDISPYLAVTLICFAATWLITKSIQNIYFLLVSKIFISTIFYIFAMKISNSVIFKESVEFLMNWIKKK
ncbi:MAG: lipopolysaccharide biosynthesis protein [Dysgonamonadaceae bacterium]|jgi:O-antigen/teichoic acid export membrane protein|nr:lipopolysaccharide biosynthesis protein [Dysgonamonadaceae bacterium]